MDQKQKRDPKIHGHLRHLRRLHLGEAKLCQHLLVPAMVCWTVHNSSKFLALHCHVYNVCIYLYMYLYMYMLFIVGVHGFPKKKKTLLLFLKQFWLVNSELQMARLPKSRVHQVKRRKAWPLGEIFPKFKPSKAISSRPSPSWTCCTAGLFWKSSWILKLPGDVAIALRYILQNGTMTPRRPHPSYGCFRRDVSQWLDNPKSIFKNHQDIKGKSPIFPWIQLWRNPTLQSLLRHTFGCFCDDHVVLEV